MALGILVTAIAAILRLYGLGTPASAYADESWYLFDASSYLGGGVALTQLGEPPPVRISEEVTWMHPPLGKWVLALGVGPLGARPLGGRLPAALFGTATVLLVYLIGLALWASPGWAALAAGLLAFDGLHIVHSRLAMLDALVTAWIAAAALFMALDRKRSAVRGPPSGRIERWFGSRERLFAGLCLGAGMATKWSAVWVLALAWVFSLAGFLDRRVSPRRRLSTTASAFLLVPMGVYVVSYFQFFAQNGPDVAGFVSLQWHMLQFHAHHVIDSPYRSQPWTWPLLLRPMRYLPLLKSQIGSGAEVLALGNPLLWWGFLAGLPLLLWRAWKRDWDAGFSFSLYAVCYLPWFLASRTEFLWYMLPAVPFMCIGLVVAVRALPARVRNPVGVGVGSAAAVLGIAFAPLWMDLAAPWLRFLLWLPGWRA
jgi:dolichyl-phosphate-mannose--protein O-mannosyl transferase